MRNIVHSTCFRSSRTFTPPLLYPGIHTFRSASLNRAIGRGIRRSQGVGFRGKENGRAGNAGDGTAELPIRRTAEIPAQVLSKSVLGKKSRELVQKASEARGKDTRAKPDARPETPRRGRFGEIIKPRDTKGPVTIRLGKRLIRGNEEERGRGSRATYSDTNFHRKSSPYSGTTRGRIPVRDSSYKKDAIRSLFDPGQRRSRDSAPPRSAREFGQSRRGRDSQGRSLDVSYSTGSVYDKTIWEHRGKSNVHAANSSAKFATSNPAYPSLSSAKSSSYQPRSRDSNDETEATDGNFSLNQDRGRNIDSKGQYPSKDKEQVSSPPRFIKSIDKRIPLSIPYTTPASEFLYGTSVVEAALKSKRSPRRKLYKFYIYTGEKRESKERDADLERLARRSGIEVARVGSDWIPLLDKMSASRPHNGYILEASPLPRPPVTSLGSLTERQGKSGFEVVLDYQNREDAAINGTFNFFSSPTDLSARKPLVLFLDSILDPGNLGGIIRTASFLGVTAIGISKNCTAFSPVVLKASAGASENMTLFTVNKPAGFIADSKLAGWKIFGAVAPTGPRIRPLISTDDLADMADPLSAEPCILMLGSEGEGLRMNLRNKADLELTIRGNGKNHGVDSLNVSVATGILCNAFLRKRSAVKSGPPSGRVTEVATDEDANSERNLS